MSTSNAVEFIGSMLLYLQDHVDFDGRAVDRCGHEDQGRVRFDSTLAFTRYQLEVVRCWPDGEVKIGCY